jgi:hypothetical protein
MLASLLVMCKNKGMGWRFVFLPRHLVCRNVTAVTGVPHPRQQRQPVPWGNGDNVMTAFVQLDNS